MAFSGGAGTAASTVKPVKLERESELRIEVGNDTPLRLRLVNGTELPPEVWLSFPPRLKFTVNLTSLHTFLFFKAKFRAFFTGYGATIELDRATETDYTADEGPRVIVVGPTDAGKSTLSRMLLSWAAKLGWKPNYVDLDIGQGSITIPGCIATTPIELPIDLVEGISLEMPLVYFYGHTTPSCSYTQSMR